VSRAWPSPSAALHLIRATTTSAHQALEAALAIARPDAGDDTYTRYLEAWLGVLEPLEEPLWASPWPAEVDPSGRAGKAEWVKADLAVRGRSERDLRAIPRQRSLPPLASEPERFGVAYVIEGSSLGGQVLLRRLLPRLETKAARFLEGYRREASAKWRAFVSALGVSLRDPRDAEAAAESARATFAGIHAWFAQRGVA
jgi:heme oxygenase